ncbi:MAG: DUF4249 family protein [Bacteroidales bacterium]|jgi:hypothetical protein
MKRFRNSFICSILIALIAISCNKEEINPEVLDITSGKTYDIVIEGFLSTEKTHCQIKLSKPIGISNSDFLPINNAQVKIMDGNKTYNFESTSIPGLFQSIDSISGEVGEKYTLIVEYDNKTYYASDSLIQCNPQIDIPIKKVEINSDFYQFDLFVHNFGFDYPSIWTFIETTNDDGDIVHFDIKDLYNLKLYNHVGSILQGVFPSSFSSTGISGITTDSLEIIKMSVSEAYYEYLVSQFNISEWSSGIFSTIPGNTKTNVSEGGTGFFHCTDVKRFRMTYKELFDLRY